MGSGKFASRREFLKLSAIGAAGAIVVACAPAAPATPTQAPAAAKPTEAPKAAAPAPAPTTAPSAPTAAPKPTEAAKPTEAPKPTAAPTTAAAPAAGVVTIDWWVPNFHEAGFNPMKPKFEAANPNIKINQIQTVSDGLYEKIFTTLRGTTQPDIIDVANGWNPIFSQAGLLRDLTDRKLDTTDWLPGPLATAQFQGKLFGVPFRSEAIAQIWNKDIFTAAGLDPEKFPTTWEELVSMAQKAHKPPERYGFGVIAGSNAGNTFFRVATFLWANGGDVLNADNTQAVCTTPEAIEAVQFYTDLVTKYKVAPEIALTATTEQMDALFSANKLAIHITGGYIRPRLQKEAPNMKWGASTTIKRKVIAAPLGGWNWVIPKNAKHPDEAWTALNFMSQPNNMAEMANLNGIFPSRKSGLQQPIFTQVKELAPFIDQLQYARATPAIVQWADVQKAFVTAVQSIIAGQKDVKSAMETAAADINKLLKA